MRNSKTFIDVFHLLYSKGLLKKHEAFESDFQVHKERCTEIKREGQTLINEVRHIQI